MVSPRVQPLRPQELRQIITHRSSATVHDPRGSSPAAVVQALDSAVDVLHECFGAGHVSDLEQRVSRYVEEQVDYMTYLVVEIMPVKRM